MSVLDKAKGYPCSLVCWPAIGSPADGSIFCGRRIADGRLTGRLAGPTPPLFPLAMVTAIIKNVVEI
jgi:hypothetical protein